MIRKKGMAVFIIFFLVAALIIFFLLQSGLKQHTGEMVTQTSSNIYRNTLGAYTELLKKYAYTSFKHGSVRGSFQSAAEGGGRPWWLGHSCRHIPTLNKTKGDVCEKSVADLNRYLVNVDGYDFEILDWNKSGSVYDCEVWVEPPDVLWPPWYQMKESLGPVDERFLISTRGLNTDNTSAKVVSEIDEMRGFRHAYTQEVWPLRFWYLWRRFHYWMSNLFAMDTRACYAMDIVQLITTDECNRCDLPGKLSKATANRLVQLEVQALQSLFDQHVVCEGRLYDECFYSRVEYPHVERDCPNGCRTDGCTYIQSNNPCYSWVENDNPPNLYTDCFAFEGGQDCQASYNGNYQGSSCSGGGSPCHGYGVRQYANFFWEVQCTDYKYQNPVETSGFKNIIFKVKGHLAWRHEVGPPNPCR